MDPHAHALYDAVYVYSAALNESLADGVNPCDRRAIAQRMFNRTYKDRTSTINSCEINAADISKNIQIFY